MSDDKPQSKIPAEIQVDLAVTRTILALDRTLLAWIRTSVALLGFGFTLAKFIRGYIASGAIHGVSPDSPRNIGIVMLFLGLGGLVGGMIEYTRSLKALKKEHRVSLWSPALVMAISLMCTGLYVSYDILWDTTP
jgi:Predicted membrane protein